VTHLRQIMLEELRRRNYAESTIHIYIHTVEHFSRHFHTVISGRRRPGRGRKLTTEKGGEVFHVSLGEYSTSPQ
jgi:hypothetical protein